MVFMKEQVWATNLSINVVEIKLENWNSYWNQKEANAYLL